MDDDIEVRPALERLVQRWHWMAIAGVLGGLIGVVLSWGRPPIYGAVAEMSVGLVFEPSVQPIQYDVDLALGKAAAIVSGSEVLEATLQELQAALPGRVQGWTTHDLLGHIRLERKGSNWEFTGVDEDPVMAAAIANVWVGVAAEALEEAHGHALTARNLQGRLAAVYAEIPRVEAMSPGSLTESRLTRLAQMAEDLEPRLARETELSRGVLWFLAMDVSRNADPPESPSTRGRGQTVLAMAALGLLTAVVLAVGLPPSARSEPHGVRGLD